MNKKFDEVIELRKNPKEFIDFLRLSQNHWNNNYECLNEDGYFIKDRWIFRGSFNAKWRLIPSAWRNNKIIESQIIDLVNKFKKTTDNKKIPSYEKLYAKVEIDIINRFRYALHDFGYPIEWSKDNKNKFEDLLDVACIAQHHGIPTRLLDWTVNPMTAAYFACEPQGKLYKADDVCVWALNIGSKMFSDSHDYIKIHEQPRNRNNYLRAQQALFTECSDSLEYHKIYGVWPSIEDKVNEYLKREKFKAINQIILMKIVLKKDEVDEVLNILRLEGINKSSIFPSLDNLASDTLNSWKLDKLA